MDQELPNWSKVLAALPLHLRSAQALITRLANANFDSAIGNEAAGPAGPRAPGTRSQEAVNAQGPGGDR